MRYILYDLRSSGVDGLAKIHLPDEHEDGPVVLHVTDGNYEEVKYHLYEMCCNEGEEWLQTMLVMSDNRAFNTSDLIPFEVYIVIAHRALMIKHGAHKDPHKLMSQFASMKQLKLH